MNSRLTAEGQLHIYRTLRGVTDSHVIDAAIARSAEARHLERLSQSLATTYAGQAELRIKEATHPVRGPIELIKNFIAIGRKGISIQRYKGLGEMNAEQLREQLWTRMHAAYFRLRCLTQMKRRKFCHSHG